MKKLHLAQSSATRNSDLLTWEQVKGLTAAAEHMVNSSGKPITPEALFFALIALISTQVLPIQAYDNEGKAYWIYFPNPPLLHPTTWSRSNIKVFSNEPQLLGGISDSLVPHKIASKITFHGITEETPMCFSTDNLHVPLGCLPLSYRTYITHSPGEDNKRDIWSLEITSLGYANNNDTNISVALPPPFKLCDNFNSHEDSSWNLLNLDTDFPRLIECGFHHTALQFKP